MKKSSLTFAPVLGLSARWLAGLILSIVFAALPVSLRAAVIFPPQGDDVTPSMGLFRIIVDPAFRPLMDPTGPPNFFSGYTGYHTSDGRMTSPTLFDNATTIGRSSRNNRPYFPGPAVPLGAGSWDSINGYGDYPAIPFQFFVAPANTEEILTEIKSFILQTLSRPDQGCSNADPRVPSVPLNWQMVKAGTFAGVAPRSLGIVQGNAPNGVPGPDFPARSFFDVFVEVNLPPLPGTESSLAFPPTGAVLTNEFPLIITNLNLTDLPPTVIYIHGATPAAVPLRFKTSNPPYWSAGDLFGSLVLAGHGTFTNDCSNEAALAAAVLGPLGTSATELPIEWLRPTTICPPPGSSYDSVKNEDIIQFFVPGQGTLYARNFSHANLNNPIPLPPPNATATYSFSNTLVLAEISVDLATWFPIQISGPTSVKINNNTTGSNSVFATELLQLDVVGGSPFGTVRLRESPTRQSLGQHNVRPDPRGFRISSFFDVFLEVSTDNGASWIPANRAVHVQASAPKPAPNSIFANVTGPITGGILHLKWLGNFPLLQASDVAGPWSGVGGTGPTFDGVLSKYDVPIDPTGSQYFRLVNQ